MTTAINAMHKTLWRRQAKKHVNTSKRTVRWNWTKDDQLNHSYRCQIELGWRLAIAQMRNLSRKNLDGWPQKSVFVLTYSTALAMKLACGLVASYELSNRRVIIGLTAKLLVNNRTCPFIKIQAYDSVYRALLLHYCIISLPCTSYWNRKADLWNTSRRACGTVDFY